MKKIVVGFFFISVILICLVFGIATLIIHQTRNYTTEEPKAGIMTISMVFSAISLWIWMLSDYYNNADKLKHKRRWGWLLLLGNWVSAIFYFLIIYKPRLRWEMSAKKGIKNT